MCLYLTVGLWLCLWFLGIQKDVICQDDVVAANGWQIWLVSVACKIAR